MLRRENVCAIVVGVTLPVLGGAVRVAHAAFSGVSDASVLFAASGPAGMSIQGKTAELSVADQGEAVVITVPLGNVTTGISLRDRHMKEKYLEVQKYPTATLSVARAALKLPAGDDRVEADVPGSVTLHGQTRPVTVHYDVKKEGGRIASHGKFHINMQEFGITVPTYLGITVKPDVDITANFLVGGG